MRAHARARPAHRVTRRLAHHPLSLALVAALAAPLAQAQAPPPGTLPTGGSVVGGSASITLPGGNTMNINQTTQGAIIDWGSFSIASDATVNFVQPGATGVALNRVVGIPGVGILPSQIFGNLNANGRVFIVNSSGVVFGGTAQVNVGGLVASTLAISNADFNAGVASGRFVFTASDPAAASIDNLGSLVASSGGTIALLAGSVNNAGSATANGGTVALASSQQVTLDFFGDGLTQVSIGLGTDDGGITNSGTLQADGGAVQLRTQTFDGDPGGFGGFIVDTGVIRARSLASRNGRIVLDAGAGAVDIGISEGVTGATIDATGTASGRTGGDIEIRGDSVTIVGLAPETGACTAAGTCTRIDASGHSGGGAIGIESVEDTDISGLGANPETPGVEILSDALAAGRGGTLSFANQGGESDGIDASGLVTLSASGFGIATGGDVAMTSDNGVITFGTGEGTTRIDVIADGVRGGGTVELDAATFLLTRGTHLSAAAGAAGSGGQVRTISGDLLDLRGITVAAGGPAGAGDWQIQSGRGLAIVDGFNGFGPVGGVSLLSDDSIGGALSAGTNVDITVPAPATGTAQINIAPGVAIANTGAQPVGLTLNAPGGQILAGVADDGSSQGVWNIGSSGGALDVTMDALSTVGLYQGTLATNGGALGLFSRNSSTTGVELSNTTVITDGGDVDIAGESATTFGVLIGGGSIDTRIGQDAANAGGAIRIFGQAEGVDAEAFAALGVSVSNSALLGSTGALQIEGQIGGPNSGFADAVSLFASDVATTSGNIEITGTAASDETGISLGGFTGDNGSLTTTAGDIVLDGSSVAGIGVDITTHAIATASGGILIVGRSLGNIGLLLRTSSSCLAEPLTLSTGSGDIALTGLGSAGLRIDNAVSSTLSIDSDSGRIELRGRATGADAGVFLSEGTELASGGDVAISGSATSGAGIDMDAGASVDAGDTLLLRAGNGGGTDALALGGSLSAAVANLRPGEVDATGGLLDRVGDAIALGGATTGFALSAAELANIAAPDLVLGHAGHAGAITVAEAIGRDGNLTLHNTGGAGGIALNAAIDLGGNTLALVSGGDIAQTAAAGITAQSLLARSTGGSVALTTAQNNVSGSTLAGGAAGDFGYTDLDALSISEVTAVGFDAAGQAATTLAAAGIDAGGALFVRNNAGDLTLGADVSGTEVDLVTAGRLQNIANATIAAGNRWRVWAETWIGEQRGGLAGSGPLPNLFNCSFGGACGVTVPASDNHFIYRQQPTATIAIDDATREYGLDNPAFTFDVGGLVFADDLAANVIAGIPGTAATILSDVGNYLIGGSFTSPAGYAITLDPGTLAITPATLTFVADPFSRVYGDPNGALGGSFGGFRNGDTLADLSGTLVVGTDATQASDVGSYAIFGSGVSSLNYNIVNAPGNATALTVTPATLTYVADPLTLVFGQGFAGFNGTVTGFRNDDTLQQDTEGTLVFSATVGPDALPGVYPILGSGLSAGNYTFVQAPANFTALRVNPAPITELPDLIRLPPDTYVYNSNIGTVPMCPVTGPLESTRLAQGGDMLGREWSKVRSRPNLTSCVSNERKNGCGDF